MIIKADLPGLPRGGFGPPLPGTTGMAGALTDVIVARCNHVGALKQALAERESEVALLHPKTFETMYLSSAHSQADVNIVLGRMADAAASTLVR
jgi:hypothetical protein